MEPQQHLGYRKAIRWSRLRQPYQPGFGQNNQRCTDGTRSLMVMILFALRTTQISIMNGFHFQS